MKLLRTGVSRPWNRLPICSDWCGEVKTLKFWRPIFIGFFLGVAAAVVLPPRGGKPRRIKARIKRTVNLLNDLKIHGETALRNAGIK